jgi:predicted nucleic acid-binding protein
LTELLYVDSSALLRRALEHPDGESISRVAGDVLRRGGEVVSSRLLWLEARRAVVRERLNGNNIADGVIDALSSVTELRMTDQVWDAAYGIEQHVKTLDALHIATCLLAEATLLSFDTQMNAVALSLGIPLADVA